LPDELPFLELDQLPIAYDTRVVDNHVDPPMFGDDLIYPPPHGLAVSHVDFVEFPIYGFGDFFASLLCQVTDDDFGTLFGKPFGSRFADPRRAAGD
jgi:hypothetical protein